MTADTPSPIPAPAPAAQLRRVILIDDSEIDAELLRMRLQALYPDMQEVLWIREATAIVERIADFGPDLVITDYHMPGYNVLATVAALRQRWPLLPVLVVSGLVGEEAAVQLLKAGASDFLAKSRSERLAPVIARELAEAEAGRNQIRLQSELALQSRINEAIFEQLVAGLWILSPQGALVRTNPHGEQMLGGAPLLGIDGVATSPGWWADSGRPLAARDWPGAQALEQRRHVPPRLIRVCTEGGQMRHISFGAAPLTAPDGSNLGAIITAMDLSEEVALQGRLRDAESRLRSLSLNQSDQHERQMARVARDLHDNLGQVLSLLKLHLGSAARADMPATRRGLEIAEALPLVDLALSRLREVCNDLLPSELSDFGLLPALESLCNAAGRASGLVVQATETGDSRALQQQLQLGLFRVAQQALTNALRHASADQVQMQLCWEPGAVALTISDDGDGFDPLADRQPRQQGLRGMRERMELLGGTLRVDSSPGHGTSVCAHVPTGRRA